LSLGSALRRTWGNAGCPARGPRVRAGRVRAGREPRKHATRGIERNRPGINSRVRIPPSEANRAPRKYPTSMLAPDGRPPLGRPLGLVGHAAGHPARRFSWAARAANPCWGLLEVVLLVPLATSAQDTVLVWLVYRDASACGTAEVSVWGVLGGRRWVVSVPPDLANTRALN
jgi:hypothetical protein